jgi:hypothetical protein
MIRRGQPTACGKQSVVGGRTDKANALYHSWGSILQSWLSSANDVALRSVAAAARYHEEKRRLWSGLPNRKLTCSLLQSSTRW